MKHPVRALFAVAGTVLLAPLADAQERISVSQAVDLIVSTCMVGGTSKREEITFDATAGLLKKSAGLGAGGTYKLTQSEAKGVVEGINNKMSAIQADQVDKVRECLKPRIDKLLDFAFYGAQAPEKRTLPSSPVPAPSHPVSVGKFEFPPNAKYAYLFIQNVDDKGALLGDARVVDEGPPINAVRDVAQHLNGAAASGAKLVLAAHDGRENYGVVHSGIRYCGKKLETTAYINPGDRKEDSNGKPHPSTGLLIPTNCSSQ